MDRKLIFLKAAGQTLRVNTEDVRRETLDGRSYIVAPVVAVVEGVHNQNYHPASVIQSSATDWNGMPVTVYHPIDERGELVSANDPEVLVRECVGRLADMHYDDGLRGLAWIEEDRLLSISPSAYAMILSGEELDVSIGFGAYGDEQPGEWNGEEYVQSWTTITPDHLALLPGAEGACNWGDGCGFGRANEKVLQALGMIDVTSIDSPKGKREFLRSFEALIRRTSRRPSFSGTESTSWENVKTSFKAYRDAYYRAKGGRPDEPPSRVQDAPSAMRNWIASKTLLGDGAADNDRDLIFFPVVNPRTNKLNDKALRAVIGGRGSQARIPAEAKTSAQRMARRLLNEHFGAELEVGMEIKQINANLSEYKGETWVVALEVGHTELRDGLQKIVDGWDSQQGGTRVLHWVREVYDDRFIYEARTITDNSTESKLFRLDYSVGGEEEIAVGDSPVEVRQKIDYPDVTRQGGAPQPQAQEKENRGEKKEDVKVDGPKANQEKVQALIACPHTRFTGEDSEFLSGLSDCQLDKLKAIIPEKPPEVNTVEEYIAAAPEALQGVLKDAAQVYAAEQTRLAEEKKKIIDGLMENPRNKFKREQLEAKGNEELAVLADLAQVEHDHSGAGGSPETNEGDIPELKRPDLVGAIKEKYKKN